MYAPNRGVGDTVPFPQYGPAGGAAPNIFSFLTGPAPTCEVPEEMLGCYCPQGYSFLPSQGICSRDPVAPGSGTVAGFSGQNLFFIGVMVVGGIWLIKMAGR